MKRFPGLRCLWGLSLLFTLAALRLGAANPTIAITNLPAFGTTNALGGYVANADFTTNCVAVFIFVDGGWYSKPSCQTQLTPLRTNGTWSANVASVASDTTATEFAACLVPTNYNLPCVNGTNALVIPPQAMATTYAVRVDPATRRFNFAGYGWWVKDSRGGTEGPGPNYFSSSTNNIWVDAQGWLHLKITYTNSQWQCAEIISDRSFGYGQYRFSVNTPVSVLGSNVVLGLFTWSDDAAYNDREIDIEQSRWNYDYGPNKVEDFAISPYNSGQQTNFALATTLTNSTHSFIWQSNTVAFQTLRGDYTPSPASSNLLAAWSCSQGIPPAGGEQVHLNLWLINGTAPQSNLPVEMVLTNFAYVPLGSPQPANWLSGSLTNQTVQMKLQCLPDWHYIIQSSSDLLNWTNLTTLIATNPTAPILDTNLTANRKFYRAITEP